jgi:hypothetical protein
MPLWLTKLQPNPWLLRKLIMLAILVGVGLGGFLYGRRHADAAKNDLSSIEQATPRDPEYYKRVVGYLFDNQPIYRAELGEYLIQRFGADRLDYMVNRRIVEMECQKYSISVSDGEVEARFQQDLQSFGTHITEKEFVNSILRRFNKTLYEWKEDVIRPKIMMEKLVHATVQIKDADLREGFDARYGPKVECRMIVIEKGNLPVAQKVWDSARKGRESFMEEARKQFIPNLAMEMGKVPPIHKHFGDKLLEESAFRLKEGEVSGLLKMEDGTYVILFCEKHLPANISFRFEDQVAKLHKEMHELRVAQKIPDAFAEMRKRANPRLLLSNIGTSASVVPPPLPLPSASSGNLVSAPVKIDMPPPPVVGEVKTPVGILPKLEVAPFPKVELPPPTPKESAPLPTTTTPAPMPMPMPMVTPPASVIPPPTTPSPLIAPPAKN